MKTKSVARFDNLASNFLNSEVHQWSPSMEMLHETLGDLSPLAVCDVACGAGHLAMSFAGKAQRVTAVDPAPNMLEVCRTLAKSRSLEVETVHSYAEEIPLPDAAFDVAVTRLAAHHFVDVGEAVREMTRIVRVGGTVAVIDLQGFDEEEADELNHQIELLHDPTHQRSYRASHWQELFESAGLVVKQLHTNISEKPDGVTVKRWCEIASSGEEAEIAIRRLLEETPEPMLGKLGIRRSEQDFLMPIRTLLIIGHKPDPKGV